MLDHFPQQPNQYYDDDENNGKRNIRQCTLVGVEFIFEEDHAQPHQFKATQNSEYNGNE